MKFHIRCRPVAALLRKYMAIEQILVSRLSFSNLIQSNSLSYYYHLFIFVKCNSHISLGYNPKIVSSILKNVETKFFS